MAGYAAVRDAVESIAALLRTHITASGEAGLSGVPVRVASPRETETDNIDSAVAVWLHRVDVAADRVNALPDRPAPGLEGRHPVPVELALQVVPMHKTAATAQLLLGRTIQVLADHRRLTGTHLVGGLAGATLTLALEWPGAYELNLLWAGQQTTQRPGVGVRVLGVTIDSHLDAVATSPVLAVRAPLAQIVGVAP